ncbi:MAG: hypothetical protein NW703_12185 [Nitrospiraceae bacterium]
MQRQGMQGSCSSESTNAAEAFMDNAGWSNQFGRYGSPLSPDSINNPFGAGSPYRYDSSNNPYGEGWSIKGR